MATLNDAYNQLTHKPGLGAWVSSPTFVAMVVCASVVKDGSHRISGCACALVTGVTAASSSAVGLAIGPLELVVRGLPSESHSGVRSDARAALAPLR
jgi:hypothetical protein